MNIQSSIRSIFCLYHNQKCESLLISRILEEPVQPWIPVLVAWVLELKTHLFRGKIQAFQRAYSIKRKTSLSISKTPMRQTIFAKTFDAGRNLNQQGSYWHPMMLSLRIPPISEMESLNSAPLTQSFFASVVDLLNLKKILGFFTGCASVPEDPLFLFLSQS